MRLLAGGPEWAERKARTQQAKFTKRQKLARKPLLKAMRQLDSAVVKEDWRTARMARSEAWSEVNKLSDELTREERKKLWELKQRILAGEARERLQGKRPPARRARKEAPETER